MTFNDFVNDFLKEFITIETMRYLLIIIISIPFWSQGQHSIEKRFRHKLKPNNSGEVDSAYVDLHKVYNSYTEIKKVLIDEIEQLMFNQESEHVDVRFGSRLLLEIGSDRCIKIVLDATNLKKTYGGPTNASEAIAILNGHEAKNPVIEAIAMGGDRSRNLTLDYIRNSDYLNVALSEKQLYHIVRFYKTNFGFYQWVDDHYSSESNRGQNLLLMKNLLDKKQ